MNIVIYTIIFGLVIFLIDIFWISIFMKKKYINLLSNLNLKLKTNVYTVIIAYFIMILAFPFFIFNKNKDNMLKKSFLIGLIIYGTYSFTLTSILPYYNINLAIIETLWGCFLYFISTYITIYLLNY